MKTKEARQNDLARQGGIPLAGGDQEQRRKKIAPAGKWRRKLLQGAVNRRELVVHGAAQAVHHGDDRQGDARGNQTVFDRRRTGFIRPELLNHAFQDSPPFQFQAVLA